MLARALWLARPLAQANGGDVPATPLAQALPLLSPPRCGEYAVQPVPPPSPPLVLGRPPLAQETHGGDAAQPLPPLEVVPARQVATRLPQLRHG